MVSGASWPKLTTELRPWTPSVAPDLVSASVRRKHSGSYRAAVVQLIADRTPQLPTDVVTLVQEASVEIARFDAELGTEAALFASVLLRSEAVSSSMVKDISSRATAIALAELGSAEDRDASEIIGNVVALRAAFELAEPCRRCDPGDA